METSTLLGLGALVVSAAGALNSLRKTRVDERSGAIGDLRNVVQTYKEELARLKQELLETEDECRRQIAECRAQSAALQSQIQEMRATIISQANQISQLERRKVTRGGE